MPKKDKFHHDVRIALIKDGWTITADPMSFKYDDEDYYPDLAAEQIIAASNGVEKIAVEIKSFISTGFRREFYEAMGQYDTYSFILSEIEPDRKVILAISMDAYDTYFQKKSIQKIITFKKITVVVYNFKTQTIEQWIK